MKPNVLLKLLCFLLLVTFLGACSSQLTPEEAIPNPIPQNSKFAKIQLGWSINRVHDTIGKPTDSHAYSTGKAWIPFYFGSDYARVEDIYKGEGRIVYTGGTGFGARSWTVYKIIYNKNESGYNDKK